jgi:hypothetical protein
MFDREWKLWKRLGTSIIGSYSQNLWKNTEPGDGAFDEEKEELEQR